MAEAEAAFKDLLVLELPTAQALPLLEGTLRLAIQHERSVYDSVYLTMARNLGAEFVTADEKLVNAVAGRLPVKWIGTFVP